MTQIQMDSVNQPSALAQRRLTRLRETTGQIVGSLFYGTLLKMMRESELKGPYGHGGRGEEIFSAQLHGVYAERLGTATRTGLSETLYNAFEKQTRLVGDADAARWKR